MTTRAESHDRAMLLRGTVMLALVSLVLGLLFAQARGTFGDDVDLTARLSSVGDGLAPGADVKYRGVLVGRVTTVDVRSRGGADVGIRLHSAHADDIPGDVVVRRVPSNIFAQPSIEFTDPRGRRQPTAPVSEHAVLEEDTSKESLEIQTAITKAYDLISAVNPEQLTVALDVLAQALDGNGRRLGRNLARADRYVGQITDRRQQIDVLLHDSVAAIASIRRSSPDLLVAIRDALVPARTIANSRADIRALVGAATGITDLTQSFLDQNMERLITVVRDLRPVATTLGLRRRSITGSFVQLGKFVAWARRIPNGADGPVVKLDFRVNPELLRPYTAHECATYPGIAGVPAMSGPNCGSAARGRTLGSSLGGTVGSVGSPEEHAIVDAVTAALSAGMAPAAGSTPVTPERGARSGGDATLLLLGPLLRGTEVETR